MKRSVAALVGLAVSSTLLGAVSARTDASVSNGRSSRDSAKRHGKPSPGPAPASRGTSSAPAADARPEPGCEPKCRLSQRCEARGDGAPECVDPPWLPVSCAALADDPPGLLRSGPGCDAEGGTGTGTIVVTALGPDDAKGTLRWAYRQIDAKKRIVVCDPSLKGEILLGEKGLLWSKPYTTLDFSMCDVDVRGGGPGQPAINYQGTHDSIVFSVRSTGYFNGGGDGSNGTPKWVPRNNTGQFAMDGWVPRPVEYPWDKKWDKTPPDLRRIVKRMLFDRVTATNCEDDCLMAWEGVRDVTVSRSLIQGFHPTTMGAGGFPRGPARQRLRIGYLYDVWFDSGERQIKPRENSHLWVYARNLVYNWTFWPYWDTSKKPAGPGVAWAMGLNITDDGKDENDLGYVIAPCFVPGPGSKHPRHGDHSKWDVIVGNGWTCEYCPLCRYPNGERVPPTDYAKCNPPLAKSRYWFEAVEGYNAEGATNPPGWVPPPLPFEVDKTRPWSRVLAEVGVVKRNAGEQAAIDRITAELPNCKVRS